MRLTFPLRENGPAKKLLATAISPTGASHFSGTSSCAEPWTFLDWKQKVDWMAAHRLNTLIYFVGDGDIASVSLLNRKYPDISSLTPWMRNGRQEAGTDPLLPDIIRYCHGKGMKVVVCLMIDSNGRITDHVPQLCAMWPEREKAKDYAFIMCPSQPAVRSLYRNLWEELVTQFSQADGFGVAPPDSGVVPSPTSARRSLPLNSLPRG